jgi:protein-tyrosine phosphatase
MYSFKASENIYDWISCLIKDKLYFGPFPNQNMIDKLFEEKFDIIVNLTMDNENIFINFNEESKDFNLKEETQTYKVPKNKYISYQIKDNDVPECPLSYCSFIINLKKLYLMDKKIYIHCRGGHGRSGMVSVSLLLSLFPDKNINEIIDLVNQSHINRIILRKKWKNKKAPFNYNQYIFILKVHKNIYINNSNKYYNWLIFNDSISYENEKYESIYKFYTESLLEYNQKIEHIKNNFKFKIKSNKDIEYKFYLTYLKNIIITDCDNKEFCKDYSNILYQIREDLISP